MADIGVQPKDPTTKLQNARDRQNYYGWQARLASIEVRREEVAIELKRLEDEEKTLIASVKEHEAKYATTGT